MSERLRDGDCVRLPDGRVARVREVAGGTVKVRVRTPSGRSDRFESHALGTVEALECPRGWMSPEGYRRYLAETLRKARLRRARKGARG
jgi:hypothetical protein